jgi:hypothetical protein
MEVQKEVREFADKKPTTPPKRSVAAQKKLDQANADLAKLSPESLQLLRSLAAENRK